MHWQHVYETVNKSNMNLWVTKILKRINSSYLKSSLSITDRLARRKSMLVVADQTR